MRPGRMNKYVTLWKAPDSTPDADGFLEALDPPDAWVQIQPLEPFESDGTRVIPYRVTMRYHAQINVDSMLKFGTRDIFVKGVQNVDEGDREMRLYCEEVVP